jgi:uncharacterized membrane protein YdjX (TVP38/TMEM64 family)
VHSALRIRFISLCVLVVLAAAAVLLVDLPSASELRAWMNGVGPLSWVGLIVGLTVTLLTPAPRSALSVVIGMVLGFPAGLVVVLVGSILGGLAGYGVSRWLGRAAVERLAGARLNRVERMLNQRSVQAVLIARVMPVVPFFAVSYLAGLGGVRLGPYTAGTALGVVPGSVYYVGIGTATAAFASSAASFEWTLLLVVPVVALVCGTVAWRKRWLRVGDGHAGSGHRPQQTGAGHRTSTVTNLHGCNI